MVHACVYVCTCACVRVLGHMKEAVIQPND